MIVIALACACESNGGTTAPSSPTLSVQGRLERSLAVGVQLTAGGAAVPGAVLTATPAANVIVFGGDSLQLLADGPLTITARGVSGGDSVHATANVTVAVPPTIVFDRLVSGNRDIWSVQLDGRALTRLTTDPSDDRQPTARGGRVYFISFRTGTAQLFKVALAGGADARVTSDNVADGTPALAPNGSTVVFASGSAFPKITLADTAGANETRFAAANGGAASAIEERPAWSPSGDRIAYTTTRDGWAGIYVGQTAGAMGSATPLVSGANGYASVEPAWSFDGNTVAFASDRDGPTDLYLITIANGAVARLTTLGQVGQPAWLPDGRVVFTQSVGSGAFALRWVDPADTAHVHQIPTGQGSAEHAAATP
jgi:Tol biopolymer transport system component